ncbi:MAG: FAD-dependent monooxygenase [Natronospirillum sp.]|uniref:FAD-dependent oxidoreductase n=1 Tax=Natronospirillum sp. TaxID=2812955 RepID=UPI0025EFCAC1|nr:NAD(P)/FAD-dependent oxidoreductase [Natronospirillum sp.]MCH8551000.1 FAD-dependent monooxygenase [Natronospirillum sp.]
MKKQRIAVVGAGTAGLATATLLGRQGHAVTVIERANSLGAVGAGLLLQPSAISALSEMGCLEHMQQYGQRIDALFGWTRSGRAIMQVEYAHLGEKNDVFGLGVHRSALCHVLDTALETVPHDRWFGCEVSSIGQSDRDAVVAFRRDAEIHREAFDAVVIANGSASQLRPPALVRFDREYPWGAMWMIRPLTENLAALNRPHLQQKYDGSAVMVGALPTGCIPDADGTPMLSLFWSLPVSEISDWRAGRIDLALWKTQVIALWPELEPLISAIASPSELLPATYRDVIMSRWAQGRVGVIGDAAHAMSPQLGQGANMALLDATALASAVRQCENWDEVWGQYYRVRQGSIRFYQRMSRFLTPLFQSRMVGAARGRDLALPLSHRIPWVRRQMAETVAGRKQRWIL